MFKEIKFWRLFFIVIVVESCSHPAKQLWLDELNIKSFSGGIPAVESRKPGAKNDSIMLGGIYFNRGIAVQSVSVLSFYIDGNATRFMAMVGPEDRGNKATPLSFFVIGDRKILFESGEMNVGDAAQKVDVDLRGIKRLGLLVTNNGKVHNGTYAAWAEAKLSMEGNAQPQHFPNTGDRYILTPPEAKAPRINSPEVFGARPGNPFLFTVAVSGQRPVHFEARQLPDGLFLDSATGIITGKFNRKGVYMTTLIAENAFGEAKKQLLIKIGDTIALTPPMGWNGWNSWARNIDSRKVISSADAMVSSGLRDHGWSYVNIDDTWQGARGGKFQAIQPNEKFPAFKEMISHIHSLGLKVGIYSTPWISSYAGYTGGSSDFEDGAYPDSIRQNKRAYRHIGKYRFEINDARQMADWGIDYLKYDWRMELSSAERMSEALKNSGRDILYSLSNSAPFAYAKDWARVANMYRTGPDIRDSWTSLYFSAFTIDKWGPFGGPGHWNDPDMLILGNVSTGSDMHPTRLTPDEQYSQVSLFSLLSAPLLIGCPIEQLDSFTLNLLTNDEVIAVDQDPMGKPARLLIEQDGIQVWMKAMSDGSFTVGMFNIDGFGKTPQSYFRWGDETPKDFELDFKKLKLRGKWKLRDVWRQKDTGIFENSFRASIPHHGVVMIRMFSRQ